MRYTITRYQYVCGFHSCHSQLRLESTSSQNADDEARRLGWVSSNGAWLCHSYPHPGYGE